MGIEDLDISIRTPYVSGDRSGSGLFNYTKRGKFMDTSHINDARITYWEDPNIFRSPHTGKYYMFFSGDTTTNFRHLWLWEFNNLSPAGFQGGTLIGPILDNPVTTYDDVRLRAANVLIDWSTNKYVAAYQGKGSVTNGGCLITCPIANFPAGPWTKTVNNPITAFAGSTQIWMLYSEMGKFYGVKSDAAAASPYLLCSRFVDDAGWREWQIPATQRYGTTEGQLRGLTKIGHNLIMVAEAIFGANFALAFPSIWDGYLLSGAPVTGVGTEWVKATLTDEGTQVANGTLYYDPKVEMLYLFYQGYVNLGGYPSPSWHNLLRIDIPLPAKRFNIE